MHAANALRTAVRSALLTHSGIMDSISGIYDTAPAPAQYPYITFGDDRLSAWSTQSFNGVQHDLLLNCWSDRDDFSVLYALHSLIRSHLLTVPLSMENHDLVTFYMLEERFIADRRRKKRLGVLRYRALSHPSEQGSA